VEVVTINQRVLLATASDLSVRLWSLHGQFLGVFGQPDTWTHLGIVEMAPLMPPKTNLAALKKQRASMARTVSMALSSAFMVGGHSSPIAAAVTQWSPSSWKLRK